jgi:DNA-binding NarL/FixJ family response regulator
MSDTGSERAMPRILIADDHPLFREALKVAVLGVLPGAVIVEADSADVLFAAAEANPQADLLLLDLNMPGVRGYGALVHLRAVRPQLPVIVVSAREDPMTMRRALDHGAAGFIPKSADARTIHLAIDTVLMGGTWAPPAAATVSGISSEEAQLARRVRELTPQQLRVLTMLGDGLLNKQVGEILGISEATVKNHMTEILRKLRVRNRTQAVLLASRLALDPAEVKAAPEDGN